jgi:heptose-I-phosphate ethanolaminephosphotransferase
MRSPRSASNFFVADVRERVSKEEDHIFALSGCARVVARAKGPKCALGDEPEDDMAQQWWPIGRRFALWNVAALLPSLVWAAQSHEPVTQLGKCLGVLILSMAWALTWPLVLLCTHPLLARAWLALVNLVMTAFVLIASFHLVVYDQLPGVSVVYAITDTHPSEVAQFVGLISKPWAWVAGIGNAALVAVLGWRCRKALFAADVPRPRPAMALGALGLLVGLPWALWGHPKFVLNNPITFVIATGKDVLSYRADLMSATPDSPAWLRATVRSAHRPSRHLLILGESLTSTHLATCGYTRDTTPEIDRRRSFDRFVLCDACSSQNNTALSLRDVMTPGGRYAEAPFLERPNLISTLQRSSYRVYWISNQTLRYDPLESMASIWSSFASTRWFTNLEGYQYDGVMLPRVEKALIARGDRKVVVVHMAGSHPAYAMRYPPAFARWSSNAEVPASVPRRNAPEFLRAPLNEYDNSVLYTDHVVGRLLELAERYHVDSVTFFSDHGQNLGETSPHLGHSGENGPRQGYMVPVFFWLSRTADVSPAQREELARHAALPFQTDQLLPTLLELYGISTEDEALANSLLRGSYTPIPRVCDRMK